MDVVVEGAPVGVLGRIGSRSATFARSSRNLSNSGKKELGIILKEEEPGLEGHWEEL